MLFYRCDKCQKEIPYNAAIYRIKTIAEIYDDNDGAHYWRASRETRYFDVCYECARDVMQLVVDQFIKVEGAEKDND